MYRCFLLLLVFCAAAATVYSGHVETVPRLDGRIVGGDPAYIKDHPHQISMQYNGRHRCGGSIYKANKIISAAHCVNTLANASNLTIVAGSTYLSDKAQELSVKEFIIHELYNPSNNDYDVAILILNGEFEYNENVQPIALVKERPATGTEVTVTGWGTLYEDGPIPDQLQRVNVFIHDQAKCNRNYLFSITSRMICAQVSGGGKDSCQGDSGGPLVLGNELVGIVSWGIGCARSSFPGVYASVDVLRDWINSTVDKSEITPYVDFL